MLVGRLPSNARCGASEAASRGRHAGRLEVGPDLARRPAQHQRLGLREAVRDEQPVLVREVRDRSAPRRRSPRARAASPGAGAGRTRAARWSRARPHDGSGRVVDGRRRERDALSVALHVELLQVGGEPIEALVVGEHRVGLGPEEVDVPHPEQGEDHRHVPIERRIAEVAIHRVRAGEQLAKPRHADGDRDRQPDRGPQRIAATDPVVELERVLGPDSELDDRRAVRRRRHEVPRHRRFVAEGADEPSPRGTGVHHRLDRGERLRRHHEQGSGGIEPARASRSGARRRHWRRSGSAVRRRTARARDTPCAGPGRTRRCRC